jgi:hypothetical protein
MGIEPLVSGLARVWSVGVDSGCCEDLPESRPGETDLSVEDGKRSHLRCAARNASAARSKPISTSPDSRRKPTSPACRISSAIPSNYRDIEKQHYPAIARSEQDIVGPSEGAHQIYASLGSGRHRRRKGRSGRAAEIATGPVRIEACVADQFFDWKPESAQAPGLNVFKLRFGRVVRRADRRGGRRHGITDRDLAGPDARARST